MSELSGKRGISKTDLTSGEREALVKLGALTDRDIDVANIPEAAAANWKHAVRGAIRVDRDVLQWFEEKAGPDYAVEINRVLRLHIGDGTAR